MNRGHRPREVLEADHRRLEAPPPSRRRLQGFESRRRLETLMRWASRWWPRDFRERLADDMAASFAGEVERLRETRGRAAAVRWAARTLLATLFGSISARRGTPPHGGPRHRRATRRERMMNGLFQDVGHGLRRLRDAPGFGVAVLLTLGLGIGAVTTIYSAVGGLLLHPVPFRDLDSLVVLGEITAQRGLEGEGWTHPGDLNEWRRQDAFAELAALRPRFSATLTAPGEPTEVIGYQVSPGYFDLLGVEALHGRALATGPGAEDEPAVVLGHRFWRRRFGGDPGIVGRTATIDGQPRVIVGVLPPNAEYPMGTDLYVPLSLTPEEASSFSAPRLAVVGRLAPGVSMRAARAALNVAAARVAEAAPDTHADRRADVASMLETVTYGTRRLLGLLMGAAGFLLLLVCANVASLQLSLATTRQQEMAVRKALGAGRGRLVRQLLAENVSLAVLAACLATLMAVWGADVIHTGLSGDWWRFFFTGVDQVGVNAGVLLFALVTSLTVTTVCGLVPALRASDVRLGAVLRTGSRVGGPPGRARLRAGLVVAEVALAVILLCGAGLMVRASDLVVALHRGFDDEVTTLAVRLRGPRYQAPEARERFVDEALGRLASLPGMGSVAITDRLPGPETGRGTPVTVAGREAPGDRAEVFVVSADYFSTLGIPLVGGRGFDEGDRDGAPPVAVASRRLAERLWPDGEAVGRRLRLGDDPEWLTVVGTVGNVARAWNDAGPSAALYVPYKQSRVGNLRFLLDTGPGLGSPPGDADGSAGAGPIEVDGSSVSRPIGAEGRDGAALVDADPHAGDGLIAAAREQLWQIDDTLPIDVRTLEEAITERTSVLDMVARLTTGFAGAALLLCIGGVYAMVAQAVGGRAHEIGVRMALGAGRRGVVRRFLRDGLVMTLAGLAIGLPVAWLLGRALASFMVGVMALAAPLYGALTLLLLVVAGLASWVPARRAASVDPVVTLRSE